MGRPYPPIYLLIADLDLVSFKNEKALKLNIVFSRRFCVVVSISKNDKCLQPIEKAKSINGK